MKRVVKIKGYERLFRGSWWFLSAIVLCYLVYSHGMERKLATYERLHSRLEALSVEKERALDERSDLLLQIESQSDPEWVRMTLMKELGMVPDGQVKVFFKQEK